MQLLSESENDTDRIGRAFAEALSGGELIALHGNLGAGKTRFVRAVANALGCDNDVINSPTFVLWQTYHGRLRVHHLDAYRLRDSDEFLEIGGEELLWELTHAAKLDAVCFLEWAERVADVLPADRIDLSLEVTVDDQRVLRVSANGPQSQAVLKVFESNLGKQSN